MEYKLKILVLTSCTGEKKFKPENQLTMADFEKISSKEFKQREKELSAYKLPAEEMYTGQQHLRLLRGLKLMTDASKGDISIDLKILSAGYGLLDDTASIVPYEMTFSGMKAKQLRNWADFLKIPEKVLSAIEDYELSIFLLGKEYLKAIKFPKTLNTKATLVFLAGKGSETLLPTGPNIKTVFLGNADTRRMGAGLVALKGRAMEILGEKAAEAPSIFEKLLKAPEHLVGFWGDYQKISCFSK